MKDFQYYKIYLEGRIKHITPAELMDCFTIFLRDIRLLPGNEIIEGEVMEPVDEDL